MALTTTVISVERYEKVRSVLKDLWDHRELFWTFFQREIKVHYKQTTLGVTWVVLQPLLATGAFALIFGRIARMPTDGLPVSLFYLSAMVAWNTFASALTRSALSMETNADLITKVYFPRVILPGAIVLGSLLDYLIGWTLLNFAAAWMGHWHWQLVAMTPILMAIQGATALGIGSVLAMINAQYRDVKHAVGFFVYFFMLATPVIYPATRLPAWIQDWLFLNPMASVVTTYRVCLQNGPMNWPEIGLSVLMASIYLVAGVWFVRKRELLLADTL